MIRFDHVTITYPDDPQPTLRDVDLVIEEGELALVVGQTGVGKSTLLGAINGLVPHFTGGTLAGEVTVDGLSTQHHPPRELAGLVGVVGQDPLAGFVTDTVEEELAYSMEQLGISATDDAEAGRGNPGSARHRRSARPDAADPLRRAAAAGGDRFGAGRRVQGAGARRADQRTRPDQRRRGSRRVLRLVHDLGVTAVIAEHRMERIVEYADRVVLLTGDGRVEIGAPTEMMARTIVAPPVVGLAKLLDWQPLPLSVRSARRLAGPLRERLAGLNPNAVPRRPVPLPTTAVTARDRRPASQYRRDPDDASTGLERRARSRLWHRGRGRWPDGPRHRCQLRPNRGGRRRRRADRPRRGGRADGPQRLGEVQPAVGAHRGRPAEGGSRRDRRGGDRTR